MKLSNRYAYAAFIRAISGAIALSVTGASKLKRLQRKFWDYRPYSRVVVGYRAFLNMKDYVRINQLEGFGLDRAEARFYWDLQKAGLATSGSG
jgi:putative transposase